MDDTTQEHTYLEEIFSGQIKGLSIIHKRYSGKGSYPSTYQKNCAVFLIVLKGKGLLVTDHGQQTLEDEALVVIPNDILNTVIELNEDESVHLLEFTKAYSEEDKANISASEIPSSQFYAARFQDCEPYTEKIKSPNTISRTVLPNGIIPRVALGTVEAIGPDKVGEHSHPMLEQLFLGLEDNAITVHADDTHCDLGEYALLHIPLGSTHWVEVKENAKMNYMWMDFFLTKEGEIWLDTHKPIAQDQTI